MGEGRGLQVSYSLGPWGEEKAAQYLQKKGYRILRRNYRVWAGEIDIIAEREGSIVFVEVKTRASTRFGSPEDSLVAKKQARLFEAAYTYLEEHGLGDVLFRFDLIAIECKPDRTITRFTHYQDIVTGDTLA